MKRILLPGSGPGLRALVIFRPALFQGLFLLLAVAVMARPAFAQNVGIGQALPQEKLHINGNLRVDGDTLMGNRDRPASVLHLLSNGGVSLKLDANDDGSERFSIKQSGPDLGSVVFEVTEAGNTTADGFGDFNGYGRFNGNFTLAGDSRKFYAGENFDVVADGSVEFYLDANADNASADFGILNDVGDFLFLVEEDKNPTVYPFGALSGQTGGIRFRELAAGGSSFIGLRAPDGLSANVWLTLPTTDGSPGQVLQTDGSGVLSWVNPVLMRTGEVAWGEPGEPGPAGLGAAGTGSSGRDEPAAWDASAAWRLSGWRTQELQLNAGDSTGVVLSANGLCWLAGQHVESGGVGGSNTSCAVLPADPGATRPSGLAEVRLSTGSGYLLNWSVTGTCKGDCTRLVCKAVCAP